MIEFLLDLIWVSSTWELETKISAQLVYLEGDHRNYSEGERQEREETPNRSAPVGRLCTGFDSQAYEGSYKEQCRAAETALWVKCLLSKQEDVIPNPQHPGASWA